MPEVVNDKVTLGGTTYEISPLRLKHLKQITKLISEPAPTAVYESLSRFYPYIVASIQEKNPNFKEEMIDEGTLDEVSKAWATIIDFSGIKIVTKQVGETKPATTNQNSTGVTYTPEPQPA